MGTAPSARKKRKECLSQFPFVCSLNNRFLIALRVCRSLLKFGQTCFSGSIARSPAPCPWGRAKRGGPRTSLTPNCALPGGPRGWGAPPGDLLQLPGRGPGHPFWGGPAGAEGPHLNHSTLLAQELELSLAPLFLRWGHQDCPNPRPGEPVLSSPSCHPTAGCGCGDSRGAVRSQWWDTKHRRARGPGRTRPGTSRSEDEPRADQATLSPPRALGAGL